MTKYLSKCCNAEVKEITNADGVVYYTQCLKCKNIYKGALIFETATPEQKTELLRECVREANQDQRHTYELGKLIEEANKKYAIWLHSTLPVIKTGNDIQEFWDAILVEAYTLGYDARRSEV